MNSDNGRIYDQKTISEALRAFGEERFEPRNKTVKEAYEALQAGKVKPIELPLTMLQRLTRRIGRNSPCPCGSGVKFKKCCFTGKGR